MFARRMFQISLVLILLVSSLAVTHGNAAAGVCPDPYVVQRGDWMSRIAGQCGVSLSDLYSANPWVGNTIYPGQVLNIHRRGGYGPVPGNGQPGPGNYQPWYGNRYYYCGPTHNGTNGNFWVVCRGDTLSKIARYYGERVSYLQWRNHIYNANRIYVGQFIFP